MNLKDETTVGLDQRTLGIALSGGGVRAALFSAGALMAALEHASAQGKRLLVSTVSGSALLALEVAWSKADDDEAAVREVADRVTKYAYWLRRRWWIGTCLALLGGALLYAAWSYREWSAAATTLWSTPIVLAAALMSLALFRTQGIWYRSRAFPLALRRTAPNIYSAGPEEFKRGNERILLLDNFVFNATSLTSGDYVSFEGMSLRDSDTVREFAEASAAFPGAFLPRTLPGRDGLFADGGIYDNTGITYFRRLNMCPEHVIAVDAGVESTPPRHLPYASLNNFINKVPRWFGGAGALYVCGTIGGALAGLDWLVNALFWLLLLAVLVTSAAASYVALQGAWNDVRWLGRGWPTTLRVTSRLHLEAFRNFHEKRGGSLSSVPLRGNCKGADAKTQLWRLSHAVATSLVDEGYLSTRDALERLQLK